MSDMGSSDSGFQARGNSQTGNDGRMGNRDNRDAWNNPIREPVKKEPDPNAEPAGISDEDIDSIWGDVKKKKQDNNNNNQNDGGNNNNNNNNNNQNKPDPAQQMKDYFTQNGMGEFVLNDADKAKIAEGDYSGLEGRILQLAQTAHVKALSSAQTLMDSKIQAGIEKAMKDAKGYFAGQDSLKQLHTALPFTKDPAIGPVAQTVMQRFLDRGASQEEAIEGVKRWSKKLADAVNPGATVNGNRNGNFGGSQQQGDNVDWSSLLSPSSRG